MSMLEDEVVFRDTVKDKIEGMPDRNKANVLYKLKKLLEESRVKGKTVSEEQ